MPTDKRSAPVAIEINDAGLILVEEGIVGPPSPGVAVWDGGRLWLGSDGWGRFRRQPRDSDDRFWDRISQQPMPRPIGTAQTSADLVHAHLAEFWGVPVDRRGGALFAVTGAMDADRISLLLGIAETIGIPVRAVVDNGLACALQASREFAAVIHVDTQLHRAVVTRTENTELLVRTRSAVVNPFGLLSLADRWLRFLAESFVRTTRFDPLDRGEDEQQLFDLLPGCLLALQDEATTPLEVTVHDRVHAIAVKREELLQVARPLYQQLVKEISSLVDPGEPTCVQLSSRLCLLPGFVDLVKGEIAVEVAELLPGAGPRALLAPGVHLPPEGGGVSYVTRMPRTGSQGISPSLVPPKRDLPSHVVGEHRTVALGTAPLYLFAVELPHRVETHSDAPSSEHPGCRVFNDAGILWLECLGGTGVYLNGTRVEGKRALRANDRIRIAGTLEEFTLVSEEVSHGA